MGDAKSTQPAWLPLADLPAGSCRGTARASPYYLGIKDAQHQSPEELAADPHASSTWSTDVLQKVQRHTVVPSFMDPRNGKILQATPELWFSCGASGGGAKAHVDQHTESTMSLQLSGHKRWRVAPLGRRAAPHIMKLYQDGQIYSREEQNRWNMLEDVVLHPGDAFFFGPGFIHQTDAEPGVCAASITWQFNIPAPSTFWRSFLPRIRWTPDLIHTWGLLRRIIMRSTGSVIDPLFDVDGDGHVSPGEHTKVRDLGWSLSVLSVMSSLKNFVRAPLALAG